jgi:hypothetical protein
MKTWMHVSIFVTILLIFTACQDNSVPTSTPTPFFIRQKEPQNIFFASGSERGISGCRGLHTNKQHRW